MQVNTDELLKTAQNNGFAIGAFNIYNLEGAAAVIQTAEELASPVILQLLPSAIEIGGSPLIAMCLEQAKTATVPVSVHLDHCSGEETINFALKARLTSVMADGSALRFAANIEFTRKIVKMVSAYNGCVEAELGKLSGEEDGITIAEREAHYTNPDQAADFVRETGVDALAICIGNVHGKYSRAPELDFDLLETISRRVALPLVLHGTSGLPDDFIERAIHYGVCKFNVNTEVRSVYVASLRENLVTSQSIELVHLMRDAISAMQEPVRAKIKLFGSENKAHLFQS